MTFKSILFCLFLYVCLVWVGAGYLYSGPKVEQIGLLWTAAGLLVVLSLILLARLFGWARLLRAKVAARPKPVPEPALPVFDDEVHLRALLNEANLKLAHVYRTGSQGTVTLSSFPVYLLIGPEASGKTSTFLNSGLEPQLLAGDAESRGPLTATRLANIWLAQDKIFLELSGQIFSGDVSRWQRLLRVLASKPVLSGWQKLWHEAPDGLDLTGTVAFCDVKEFIAAATPQSHERLSKQFQDWQERLGVMAEVFRFECPVTFLITKCDGLPYFSDFFRRLPQSETGQVLGCELSALGNKDGANARSAEAEFKRLTKSFNSLFRSLADKRIAHLANEPETARRPGIYEFPRELKRIRPALVQFLTSVFRPNALRPSPQLKGYYLTAVGEHEVAPSLADSKSHSQWSELSISLEATTLFRGDATRVIRGGGSGADLSSITKPGAAGTTRRWFFVSELFRSILAAGSRERVSKPLDSERERRLRAACFAVCTACLVLCCIFATSWTRNLRLLHSVHNSTAVPRTAGPPTIAELESLEDLRQQVSRLTSYYHAGPPLSLRWGLYAGDGILEPMRAEYFQHFKQLLLEPLNTGMTAGLAALPSAPGPNAPYTPAFRVLKAHLMISSGDCRPEPAIVSEVLKETRDRVMPSHDPTWQALADRQIQFYTSELGLKNPCPLTLNLAARERARQYLAKIQGVDRLYGGILAAAEKSLPRSQKLADLAPNYGQVLSGPNEISGVFSRDGWTYIERASHNGSATSRESCVLGNTSPSDGEPRLETDSARAIQRLFVRDYVESWRKYLSAFSVLRYNGPSDAAHKLDVLSDHKSPLLALLAMTSNSTNFPFVAPEPEGLEKVKPIVNRFFPALGGKARTGSVLTKKSPAPQELLSSPADITKAFQPAHAVVPPGGDTWVVDKNAAYIDAIAALGQSMRDLGKASDIPDPAVLQAATGNYDKALDAARKIARGFEPMGVGIDVIVARLLEAPIRQTQPLIPTNVDNLTAGKVNGQLHLACDHIRATLRKYPFQTSETDATLEEVAAAFAPSVGAIWKFQAQYLGDWTVKDGNRWKEKDPGKKPQVTPEMLNFLNRAQTLSDVFYPSGSSQPQLTYTLRPKLDPSFKDATVELDVDGQPHVWASSLQKQFVWPAPAGSRDIEVKGIIKTGSLSFPFTSRGGTWAIFRVMSDAEPRALSSRIVEWKHIRGGGGRMEEIQPAPVRLEFVDFPGGVDLFNPNFFGDLHCPSKAVQ